MKSKNIPMRRCVGCRESKPQSELIRIAFRDGTIKADLTGREPGRGAYVCGRECFEEAVKKKGFARAFRCAVKTEDIEKIREIFDEQR
ncbi:MAG: YlxR family protein [Clostridia bacterium]|nr:YlxR family protein [Bacillota bacterium]MCR4668685.1 YlxR family protein [Clostridia bacterium]